MKTLKTLRPPNTVRGLPPLFLSVAIHPGSALIAQSPDTFTATGRMTISRLGHTATLLPYDRVLIAGGYVQDTNPPVVLNTAELYDPATGTLSVTGSMANARYAHSATLLPDGRVLMAGGYPGTNAEIYDSSTGRFTSPGNMMASRQWHTATLLNNGSVLIAGGNLGEFIAFPTVGNTSAEVFDPATGIFSATGTMTTYWRSYKAGLLANGKVLIVPGSDASDFTTAELYDPGGGTFSSVPFAGLGGYGYSAATENILKNGNALVTLQLAECDYGIRLANSFEASTTTFSAASQMVYPHSQQTSATLADGSVLIVGNLLDGIGPNPGAEIYDPTSGTFSSTGMMTTASVSPTATLLNNGNVLVVGGVGSGQPYSPRALAPALTLFSLRRRARPGRNLACHQWRDRIARQPGCRWRSAVNVHHLRSFLAYSIEEN